MKVLVTGAASGIGKATAEKLAGKHETVAFDIDGEALSGLPAGIEKVQGDVRDEGDVASAVEGRELDVLVNCAGYYELGAIEDMEQDDVRKIFDTNFHGYLNFIRNAAPALRERNGRIVNVSSIAGRMSMPYFGAYCASKHAVEAATDALRMEMEGRGVEVVLVEPGPVETGFNERARKAVEKYLPDSVYSKDYEKILQQETRGVDAGKAAEKVVRAATSESPRRRYTVTSEAWLAPKLKRFLPRPVWYRLVRKLSVTGAP
ncbi:MAG: SDR family oxidoreductase [Candidatus Nanohaloarchaea archaeon]